MKEPWGCKGKAGLFQETLTHVQSVSCMECVRATQTPRRGRKNNNYILRAARPPDLAAPLDFPGPFDISESETKQQSA